MIWAEPGSKMLSAGNYDNRPTRVWAELGSWSMIGLSYYILRMLVVFNIIFFTRFITLTKSKKQCQLKKGLKADKTMFHGLCPGGGGCLASNWVPMLEQNIDERTLNNVFEISVKTTIFAVFFEVFRETAPFHCFANFDNLKH